MSETLEQAIMRFAKEAQGHTFSAPSEYAKYIGKKVANWIHHEICLHNEADDFFNTTINTDNLDAICFGLHRVIEPVVL